MLQSMLDEPLSCDQQRSREDSRERRGRPLADIVHGIRSSTPVA